MTQVIFCPLCEDTIENEIYFITARPLYNEIRSNLYDQARQTITEENFDYLNDCDKFLVLLKNIDIAFHVAKACYMILHKRLLFLTK